MLLSVYACWTYSESECRIGHLSLLPISFNGCKYNNVKVVHGQHLAHFLRMLMHKHILNNNALHWDTLGSEGM